jgi:hypothetical protein
MKKVYVLVKHSLSFTCNSLSVRVFASIKDARKVVKAEYDAELNDWKDTYTDGFEADVESEDHCCIWMSGRYMENHVFWDIEEKEVIY